MRIWPFRRSEHLSVQRQPIQHMAWCDSNAPPTMYGDRLECNCDPANPNSKSAYGFFAAVQEMKAADHAMQQALFGKVVLPDVDEGTAWTDGFVRGAGRDRKA